MLAVTTALERLWNGPKTIASLPARRPDLDTIEAAAWQVSCEQWRAYVAAWRDPNLAAEHEQAFPGLAALGIATRHVVEQVRKTRVRRGMLLWHVYNMGFILKTPRACVGIDVCGPGVEALADSLDALLITHAHRDHVHLGLITAMLHREKPVVSSFVDGRVRFTESGEWSGCPGVRVSIDIGDHHYTRPECVNDMLMFHVDAGDDGAIYHTGDNSNAAKLPTGRRCDAWMFHVRVGLDVPLALRRIDPRMAIGAHVLELGHPPERFRWRFGDALEKLSCWPADRGSVPVWGECYRLAGAEIDTHDEGAAT